MESCFKHGKWINLKKSVLGSEHQVSHVIVHHWTNKNTTLFSVAGSEIEDCILLSMPEGAETRSCFKYLKDLFPQMYVLIGKQTGGKKSFEINQIPNGTRKLPPVHFLPLCQLL